MIPKLPDTGQTGFVASIRGKRTGPTHARELDPQIQSGRQGLFAVAFPLFSAEDHSSCALAGDSAKMEEAEGRGGLSQAGGDVPSRRAAPRVTVWRGVIFTVARRIANTSALVWRGVARSEQRLRRPVRWSNLFGPWPSPIPFFFSLLHRRPLSQ